MAAVHVTLAGPLAVTVDGTRLEPAAFPGRQGRLVFGALALARRPVDRNELAEILWPNRLPASWTRDLSAVVSKLRALLTGTADVVTNGGRWYALDLPPGATVDVDAAMRAVDDAERHRAAGYVDSALQSAFHAATVLAEPFLAGDECAWVDERRAELRAVLARALTLRAEVLLDVGSPDAIGAARALVDLEPEREDAHIAVMRAELARGHRVDALRSYETLRRMLADDFGLSPSPAAEAVMRAALEPDAADDAVAAAATGAALPVAVVDALRTPIVGRNDELARLAALVEGRARVAAVLGPPGIGKSRLLAEVVAAAAATGATVVFGACAEGPAEPYRVLVDAFTAYSLLLDDGAPPVRRAARVVEHLVARDRDAAGDVPTAVATAVAHFADRRRIVLAVDDVHWSDTATIRLLDHLATVVPNLALLVAARTPDVDEAEAGRWLARLLARDATLIVEPRGLTADAVGAALSTYGAHPNDDLVRAVHAVTGGNPLFVREIGRHLANSPAPAPAPVSAANLLDAIGVPKGLAGVIDANLDRLGPTARHVLDVAAVAGGSVDTGVLVHACDVPEAVVLHALDGIRRAGVLVDASSATPCVRFEHPLVREVLVDALGTARRRVIHQRVAAAIERNHHDDLDRWSAELAHHLARAANVGSATDAIQFALRAGDRAVAVAAHDEAVHWFAHALRLAHDRDAAEVAPILTRLGQAQNHTGDAKAAQATLLDAIGRARAAGDGEVFADAVLRLGGVLVDEGFEGGGVDGRLVELLREAIDGLPSASPLRARASVRLADELHFTGDREACLALCTEAERAARAADDDDAIAAVVGARHYALYGAPAVEERLALLDEAQRLRSSPRPDPRWARDYLELGDMRAFEAASAHFERRIGTTGIASDRYYPAVWRATVSALHGDLERAEAQAALAVEVGRAAARGPVAITGVWAAQVFSIRLFDGRLGELRDLVDASADANPDRPVWRAAAAFMHLELGERDAAAQHLARLRAIGFERLPDTLDRPLMLACTAWTAAEVGTRDDARALRRLLRPYRDLLIVQGAAAPSVCAGPATFPLGMLEARLGRHDAALALLTDAERRAGTIGARRWRHRIREARERVAEPT